MLPRTLERAREVRLAAPVSVAISKRLLWEGLGMSVAEVYDRELPLFAWSGRQADAKEGVVSFLEKREPQWKMSAKDGLPTELLGAARGKP